MPVHRPLLMMSFFPEKLIKRYFSSIEWKRFKGEKKKVFRRKFLIFIIIPEKITCNCIGF